VKRIKLKETKGENEELDELVREFCRENDVAKMKGCPKCGFSAGDFLHLFCTHKYCPLREWRLSRGMKR
jgi:hypothetical protein